MKTSLSVRLRATVAASLLAAVALTAAGVALVAILGWNLTRSDDDLARSRLFDIAGLAAAGDLPRVLRAIGDDSVAQVVADDGSVLARSPNILRALVFERDVAASSGDIDADFVGTIEFDVDDMTGEEIALAADRLRALAGAIDVSVGTRVGKKGRPMADFRLLVKPGAAAGIVHACFNETSTLGVRMREDRRQILRRSETRAGEVSVKVTQRPGGARTGKAAHDDVAAQPTLDARRSARATAEGRALKDPE